MDHKRSPKAPPVYRPLPTPHVLQTKAKPGLATQKMSAPTVLQRKLGAAPQRQDPARRPLVNHAQLRQQGAVIKARAPGVVQRTILVMGNDPNLHGQAKLLARKLGTRITSSMGEFKQRAENDPRMDIIAHGNEQCVDEYNDMNALARALKLDGQIHTTKVTDIYLQSCNSKTPARLLAKALKKALPGSAIRVHGTTGRAYTDEWGDTWVMSDWSEANEKALNLARRKAEAESGLEVNQQRDDFKNKPVKMPAKLQAAWGRYATKSEAWESFTGVEEGKEGKQEGKQQAKKQKAKAAKVQ